MTDKELELRDEIFKVKDSGLANMSYSQEVYNAALELGCYHLAEYLRESEINRQKYFNFARSRGKTALL